MIKDKLYEEDELLCEEMYKKIIEEELKEEVKEKEKFKEALSHYKCNINYPFEWFEEEFLNEDYHLYHIGYVCFEKTEYPKYYKLVKEDADTYKITSRFVKQDYHGIEYYLYQTCGYCEDDYHGYIAVPMKDSKYWLMSFSI